MSSHVCCIVPPHLLQAIATSSENSHEHRQRALHTLTSTQAVCGRRAERFRALTQPRGYHDPYPHHSLRRPSIVPDHLLQAIIDSPETDDPTKDAARRDLVRIQQGHAAYLASQGVAAPPSGDKQQAVASAAKGTKAADPSTTTVYRAVYNAKNDDDEDDLPGAVLRVEGQAAISDQSANDAFDNAGIVIQFYKTVFNWNSIDNHGMHVLSSVHFAQDYENACEFVPSHLC